MLRCAMVKRSSSSLGLCHTCLSSSSFSFWSISFSARKSSFARSLWSDCAFCLSSRFIELNIREILSHICFTYSEIFESFLMREVVIDSCLFELYIIAKVIDYVYYVSCLVYNLFLVESEEVTNGFLYCELTRELTHNVCRRSIVIDSRVCSWCSHHILDFKEYTDSTDYTGEAVINDCLSHSLVCIDII